MNRFKNWKTLRQVVSWVLVLALVYTGWSQFTQAMNRAVIDAIDGGRVEQGMLLARWGGDVNSTGAGGTTLLMLASRQGSRERVRALLSMGADVHAQDDDG